MAKNEVDQISALFSDLTSKLDKMSNKIEGISISLVNLTDTINESMIQVSGNLEALLKVFETTFKFDKLQKTSKVIESISRRIEEQLDVDDFQNKLTEVLKLINTLKQLQESEEED